MVLRLRCPETGNVLQRDGAFLRTEDSAHRYRVNELGVPLFAESVLSSDAERQREHYDRIAAAYVENLDYPHTEVYTAYLDRALHDAIGDRDLGVTAELCCGRGEALRLLADRIPEGFGVDISEEMLNAAIHEGVRESWTLVQGDATKVPLADESVDSVVMLGGIHHVNDREGLFREIARILKPGGRFYWREPVSDFLLWRGLRALIYRLSPALDHETERPLRYVKTKPPLDNAGVGTGTRYATDKGNVQGTDDALNKTGNFTTPPRQTVPRSTPQARSATTRMPVRSRRGHLSP